MERKFVSRYLLFLLILLLLVLIAVGRGSRDQAHADAVLVRQERIQENQLQSERNGGGVL
jgi:hypothetical protein